ncbi:MAG: riboflavin synthase [Actinobacteria bacterium]|nr:MAG: riboflavin synthase [Actinomycetota bacterium]
MFTGLIQSLGTVAREKSSDDGVRLTVSSALAGELQQGDSIAVNGVCLTASEVDGDSFTAEVMNETLSRTSLADAGQQLLRYVVAKGSIAVDGVSLTVTECGERSFTVSLIPETLARTNLREAQPGTQVNLEVDVLAKYVERLINR